VVNSTDAQRVSFSISDANNVAAVQVAEIIQRLQNILYTIGDHLEGNEPRTRGDFPQSIKESCTLVITGLDMGSVHAEMQIGDAQTSLPGMQTLGERSIRIAGNFLDVLNASSDKEELDSELHRLIDDPHRCNRILRGFDYIWPANGQSQSEVSFVFGESSQNQLNPAQKAAVQSLLQKSPEEYEKEIFGRLTELRVDKKRQFHVDSTEGPIRCQYTSEIENVIVDSIGEFVRVRGMMTPTRSGTYILGVDDENSLETLPQYLLKTFRSDSSEKHLKEAVPIDLIFENDMYIAYNDNLGLLVAALSMKEAIEGINEEFIILWSEYVEVEVHELTDGAKNFRDKLIKLVA
jgi:hypothetical protein